MITPRLAWLLVVMFVLAGLPSATVSSTGSSIVFQRDPPTNPYLPGGEGVVQVVRNGQVSVQPLGPAPASVPGVAAPQAPEAGTTPTVNAVIEGITYDENATNNGGIASIPPDPHGAVGPNHVVHVVNTSIEWHTRAGVQQNSQSLNTFFAALNPLTRTFDPKVLYDQYAGRFLVVTLEFTSRERGFSADTSRILLAVSDDSDPNGTWFFAEIDAATDIDGDQTWADYPGFAVDSQAVYITANMFNFVQPSFSLGTRLWIVNKSPFYNGGAISVNRFDPYAAVGEAYTTTQPAHMFGTTPAGLGTFLVSYSGFSENGSSLFRVIRLSNPLGVPSFNYQELTLGPIDSSFFSSLPDATQPGTAALIDTGDRRALHAVWRNNALYATFHVLPGSGPNAGQTTAHWVQVNTSNLNALALANQGSIGGEDLAVATHTYYPAIMVDRNGRVAVGFSTSAPTLFAGAYAVLRNPTDAAGVVSPPATIAAGLDSYLRTFRSSGGRNRWGDYSAVSLDPITEEQFWVFNQYALPRDQPDSNNETGLWGTRFGMIGSPELQLSTAVASVSEASGILTGTLQRTANINTAVTFNLSSSLPARATVIPTVTMAIGQVTVPITITLLDNLLLDGPQPVTISAAGTGFVTATTLLTVTSDEVFTVTGRIFQDSDRDGLFDVEERGLSGRSVYLDRNTNNQPDADEPAATTTVSGTYTLLVYVTGTFQWRVIPFSWTQTTGSPVAFTVSTTGTLELDDVGFDGTFTFTPLITRP